MVNPELSDHSLVVSDINVRRPKPELQQFSFRDIRTVDLADFTTRLLMTDAYKNPADDVDSFYSQIESSVVAVLDIIIIGVILSVLGTFAPTTPEEDV